MLSKLSPSPYFQMTTVGPIHIWVGFSFTSYLGFSVFIFYIFLKDYTFFAMSCPLPFALWMQHRL